MMRRNVSVMAFVVGGLCLTLGAAGASGSDPLSRAEIRAALDAGLDDRQAIQPSPLYPGSGAPIATSRSGSPERKARGAVYTPFIRIALWARARATRNEDVSVEAVPKPLTDSFVYIAVEDIYVWGAGLPAEEQLRDAPHQLVLANTPGSSAAVSPGPSSLPLWIADSSEVPVPGIDQYDVVAAFTPAQLRGAAYVTAYRANDQGGLVREFMAFRLPSLDTLRWR